jgi:hypothetical protein
MLSIHFQTAFSSPLNKVSNTLQLQCSNYQCINQVVFGGTTFRPEECSVKNATLCRKNLPIINPICDKYFGTDFFRRKFSDKKNFDEKKSVPIFRRKTQIGVVNGAPAFELYIFMIRTKLLMPLSLSECSFALDNASSLN